MRQLSSLDAGFLLNEVPSIPLNTTSVWIYERQTAEAETLGFEELLAYVRHRVPLVPILHKRLLEAPGRLTLPWWVDDPHFELEYHVRHIGLAPPGTWDKFWLQLARLHARPLDRSRPLWEMYLIDGLDAMEGVAKGSFAVVTTAHHAAMDGVSALAFMNAMHTPDVQDRPMPEPAPAPGSWNLLGRSVKDALRQPAKTVGALARIGSGVLDSVAANRKLERGDRDRNMFAPETRFSGQVTGRRVVDSVFVNSVRCGPCGNCAPGPR